VPDEFQGFCITQLDASRVYLPKGAENYLKWFKPKEKHECLAVPRRRRIVIFPPAALVKHRAMMALLDTDDPQPDDIGLPAFELARAGTMTWSLTIGTDRRFLLPKEARELGIVPAEEKAAVGLVAFRQVIEIWHPDDLPAQIQESGERWVELKVQALRGLRAPEPEP
jgi:hypothetical protein